MSELQLLADVSRHIDESGRIRRAGVDAHRIAALVVGGMSPQEVLRDYPNLVKAEVDAALFYARSHPQPPRPYPHRTVKSASRDGAVAGGLDAAFEAARDPDGV